MAIKPTLPRWAQTTGGAIITGPNAPVAPSPSKMDSGLTPSEKPTANLLNWLFNQIYQFLVFFSTATYAAKHAIFAGSWVKQSSGIATTLNSVAVSPLTNAQPGAAFYVAVGNVISTTPAVLTSPDAETWTSRTGPGTIALLDVASRGSLMVTAPGSGTSVYSSTDGITWTARTVPTLGAVQSPFVFWSALTSLWYILNGGSSNSIITSPDGITWTGRSIGTGATDHATAVCDATANGLSVAVGRSNINAPFVWTSANGTSWTARTAAVNMTGGIVSVAHNASTGVTMAIDATGNIMTSIDGGITWTAKTAAGSLGFSFTEGNHCGKCLISDGEAWIAIPVAASGIGGVAYSVDDGSTWVAVRDALLPSNRGLALSPRGRLVTVGASGAVYTSAISLPAL